MSLQLGGSWSTVGGSEFTVGGSTSTVGGSGSTVKVASMLDIDTAGSRGATGGLELGVRGNSRRRGEQ